MECSEALDFLYEAFDGQLTPTQQMLLDAHRRTCFACANTLARAERFQELLVKVPQLTVPRGLEDRVIERVLVASGMQTKRAETWQTLVEALGNWRTFGLAFGTAAAAFAIILISRGVIQQVAQSRHEAPQEITATVYGDLQLQNSNGETSHAGANLAIAPGETITSNGPKPATIAMSPNLAVTLSGDTQVRVYSVRVDPQTGDPDVVSLRVDHGTVGVRESLVKDTGAIHVATDQATIVPTGTVFVVNAARGLTQVAVGEGSVAVYLPGETFNVLAGSEARITADSHQVSKLKPGEHLSY